MNNESKNFFIESEKNEFQENMNIPDQCTSANGEIIYISEDKKTHLKAHPDVIEFLEEAIGRLNIDNRKERISEGINLGKEIGITGLVQTEPVTLTQKTYFANRVSRDFPCRVDPSAEGSKCDTVTLAVEYDKETDKYNLLTAFIGFPTPSLPYNISGNKSEDYEESLDFWCQHALAYDEKVMSPVFESTWEEVLKNSYVSQEN